MRRLLWLSVGALLLASVGVASSGGATQAEARWVITDLGRCPYSDCGVYGEYGSPLAFINERGQIAGMSGKHAFFWEKGKMRDLGTLGGKESAAVAINDRGQVVGWASTKSGRRHAFLWQNGKMRDLGVLPGDTDSEAVAINRSGEIVGCTSGEADPILDLVIPCLGGRAFLWEKGRMRDLGALPGDRDVRPIAINDRGWIVGSSSRGDLGPPRAFLWRNGQMASLGKFGAYSSEPVDLNERGQIIIQTHEPGRVLLWEHGKTRLVSGEASASGINDRGQVAGSTWNAGVFLWEAGRIRFVSRDSSHHANALNERGEIVGSSSDGDLTIDPLLWESGKTLTLPKLPGCRNGEAVFLNEHDQIVGWCGRAKEAVHTEDYTYPGRIVLWTLKP